VWWHSRLWRSMRLKVVADDLPVYLTFILLKQVDSIFCSVDRTCNSSFRYLSLLSWWSQTRYQMYCQWYCDVNSQKGQWWSLQCHIVGRDLAHLSPTFSSKFLSAYYCLLSTSVSLSVPCLALYPKSKVDKISSKNLWLWNHAIVFYDGYHLSSQGGKVKLKSSLGFFNTYGCQNSSIS
jgi:hypothetical protein